MGRREDEAAELRRQAAAKAKESVDRQWHPTDGKNAADAEEDLFNAAREKQWGDDSAESDEE
jgi:hypothetical protein